MHEVMDIKRHVEPFWWSGQMWGESILPIASETVSVKLAMTPLAMPMVQSHDFEVTFEPGRDFVWEQGCDELIIPADSRIKVTADRDLYRPADSQEHGHCRDRNEMITFCPQGEYRQLQSVVTYPIDTAQWTLHNTMCPTGTLPHVTRKLAQGDGLHIVHLGDSISRECDASGKYNVPPYAPGFGPMITDALTMHFNCPVDRVNLSIGGKSSTWGVQQIDNVIANRPDLVILAFGMNDASDDMPLDMYQSNIRKIITDTRVACPQAEFLLISSMSANSQWTYSRPELYPQYRDALAQLQGDGVILADVYTLWHTFDQRKGHIAITGNGLNHPNDFGHRLYAMTLWASLMHVTGQRDF